MKLLVALGLMSATLAFAQVPIPAVPPENVTEGKLPAFTNTEDLSKRLLESIAKDEANLDLFFPEGAFLQLKALPKPKEYFGGLILAYKTQVHKEHERLKTTPALQFVS